MSKRAFFPIISPSLRTEPPHCNNENSARRVADDYLFSSTAHSMFWFDMTLEMYFDILIVRHELPDAARHVTRRRARPPMPPFRKLGHCTDMLHSNLLHMTTLFSILINDYNKTGYLVYCFYKSNKSPTSFISFSS